MGRCGPSGCATRRAGPWSGWATSSGPSARTVSFQYSGLNHLGWITSFSVDGEERIGDLIERYEELQHFDHRFAAFDAAMVRRVGAIPTEYVFYYYDPHRYVEGVARAGSSRGQDVLRLNEELLGGIARSFEKGDVEDAWSTYSLLMGVRRDTYMRTDTEGDNHQALARSHRVADGPAAMDETTMGGYEGVALRVIAGLTSRRPAEVIVNTRNGSAVPFLEGDDVVEVPALVDGGGLHPLAAGELPRSARGLVTQVKEYERTLVEAAVTGDAGLAELALSLHPLVPGISVARDLLAEYRQRHGDPPGLPALAPGNGSRQRLQVMAPGSSERAVTTMSASLRRSAGWVVVTATTRAPAAFPAATPAGESSTTTQLAGGTPRAAAASRKPSG